MEPVNPKKKNSFNSYATADVFLLLFVILLIISVTTRNEKFILPTFCSLVACGIFGIIGIKSPTKVENRTGEPLAYKPESGTCTPSIIQTGETATNIDGIKTKGNIYKLPDGIHAEATPEKLQIKSLLIGKFIYKIFGGQLTTPPDDCWKPLFDYEL